MRPNEYLIETVNDFRKIPDDRLDDCLKEFGQLLKKIDNYVPPTNRTLYVMPYFKWIDDNKQNISVEIKK